jgi:hypothetical protein
LDSGELVEWLRQLQVAGTVALDVLSVSLIKREHADGQSGQLAVQPQLQAQQWQQQVYYRLDAQQAQPGRASWADLQAWMRRTQTAVVEVWNGAQWVSSGVQ